MFTAGKSVECNELEASFISVDRKPNFNERRTSRMCIIHCVTENTPTIQSFHKRFLTVLNVTQVFSCLIITELAE